MKLIRPTTESKTIMTQFIASCDLIERAHPDCFSFCFVGHLEVRFGSVNSLSRDQIRRFRDERLQTAGLLPPTMVAPNVDDLCHGQVGSVKDGYLSADNISTFGNGKTFFEWFFTTKAKEHFLNASYEVTIIDAGINDYFLEEARLAPLSDVALILDDYLSERSDLIVFTRVALELLEGIRFDVVFYSENHASQVQDIYCQFNDFVSLSNTDNLSVFGHLPNYTSSHTYKTHSQKAYKTFHLYY